MFDQFRYKNSKNQLGMGKTMGKIKCGTSEKSKYSFIFLKFLEIK